MPNRKYEKWHLEGATDHGASKWFYVRVNTQEGDVEYYATHWWKVNNRITANYQSVNWTLQLWNFEQKTLNLNLMLGN